MENTVRSLLRQFICQLTAIPCEIETLYDECCIRSKMPNVSTFIHQLELVAKSADFDSMFLMFDALDECASDILDDVIALIHSLKKLGVKVMCTGRPHLMDLPQQLKTTAILQIYADQDDIKNYLSVTMKKTSKFSDQLKDKIIRQLVENAHGKLVIACYT
jgi:hypothetical protein